MQVQHLESGNLASTPFLSLTTAMEDPHVCCIPTQKSMFRILCRDITEHLRELLCSMISEKVIF